MGPWLTDVTPDSADVVFEPGRDCVASLRVGTSSLSLDRVVVARRSERTYQAHIDGLLSKTTYHYQVEACGRSSPVYRLETAPPIGTPIRFGVLGDSRSDPASAQQVNEALRAQGPELVVHTGDVVENGRIWNQWKREFFDPMKALTPSLPLYVAIGNHERNAPAFYEYLPYRYDPSMVDHEDLGSNFTVTYGNVFFLFVDTNTTNFKGSVVWPTKVARWVEEQAQSEAARRARWRVAVGHHPAITEFWTPGLCDEYDGTWAVDRFLLPTLVENGFHVYFTGHTHAYERAVRQGLTHIITGGGGAELDAKCRDYPETVVSVATLHYLDVTATCDKLSIQAVSVPSGTIFDQVDITGP